MYSYMYIVALCVCLLQICQLTCVPVEEVRRVLQAYCYQASYVLSTDNIILHVLEHRYGG